MNQHSTKSTPTMMLVIIITTLIALMALKPSKPIFYADEKAQELYYRMHRFLAEKSGMIDIKLTGYEKPADISEVAALPEREFEEKMAELYRVDAYYNGLKSFVRRRKYIWWGDTPNEREIWQYRAANLGKNSLYEAARQRYYGHVKDISHFYDVDGINLSPSNTGYNKRRLSEMLGSSFDQLLMQKDGLESIHESWSYYNDLDGRPRRANTDTEMEIGNEIYERAKEAWEKMDEATRTVELLLEKRQIS